MKPLLTYYGGKQRIAKDILSLMPKSDVYIEPFCGGAAIFFARGWTSKIEVLNDLDGDIVNFYQVCANPEKRLELIQMIEECPFSRMLFNKARDIINANNYGNLIERAWAIFYLIYSSFGANLESPGLGYSRDPSGSSYPKNWASHKLLANIMPRLDNVLCECEDAIKLINRYDSEKALFYMDPPYIGARQVYKHKYTQTQFNELIECLNDIKGSFLLSIYENESIPKTWEKFTINVTTTMVKTLSLNQGANTKRTELVYRKLNDHHKSMLDQRELFND